MLWYKAWLETRWRCLSLVISMVLALLTLLPASASPQRFWVGLALVSTLLNCFAAVYLGGAGVNTQTAYSAMQGFHGSMLFTLSLPVSRRRLFLVRAGLGALETGVFVAITTGATLIWRPEATSLAQALRYGIRAIVCTLAVYALSTLLACFLDEMWQVSGASLVLAAVWMLQTRNAVVSQLSPLRGMSLISYPLAAPMCWAPLLCALIATAVLLCASVLVLQRKEY